MISKTVTNQIISIIGRENYFDSDEDKIAYSYDATPILRQTPHGIAKPTNVEQISQLVKLANDAKFSIVARGSGTGLSGGSIPVEDSIVLATQHWNKILELDESNLSLLVEPGVITSNIHSFVEKKDLFYPPDPGSMTISTIGGNVAENSGGLRGLKYGVTKNYILGLEVVLPSGEIVFCGNKNMKDVAGYNLKDHFVGSEGTLGIFTKILLKLIPKPNYVKTLLVYFDSNNDAAKAVSQIISSKILPCTIEFIDKTTINCIESYSKLGLQTDKESLLLIELDGHKIVVDEDLEKIKVICEQNKSSTLIIAQNEVEAVKLKMARRIAFSSLARIKPTTILEDVSVPRSELPKMLEKIENISKENNVLIGNFGHAGDGNLHPTILTNENDKLEFKNAEIAFDLIMNESIKLGGSITGEHGTGLVKKKFLPDMVGKSAIDTMQKIKSALDPNSVLNPGKIFSLKPKCEGSLPQKNDQIKKFVAQGAWI
ncbi:MAG: FAD-binding protein [Bacteroidetes bacterium]|nr:FAD-binding protein [Bacteroidota bacterium]